MFDSAKKPRTENLDVQWLRRMLTASLVMEIAYLASAVLQLILLPASIVDPEELRVDEIIWVLVGLPYFIVYLTTLVIFARWILNAHKKVRALGANDIPISPTAAVGYFFIPILNLFKPYEAMKNLWQASMHPNEWRSEVVSGILPKWWTLWIIANILGQLSFKVGMKAETSDSLRFVAGIDIISGLVGIALVIIARRMVVQITNQVNRWVATK